MPNKNLFQKQEEMRAGRKEGQRKGQREGGLSYHDVFVICSQWGGSPGCLKIIITLLADELQALAGITLSLLNVVTNI